METCQRSRHVRFAPIASEFVPCNDPSLCAMTDIDATAEETASMGAHVQCKDARRS